MKLKISTSGSYEVRANMIALRKELAAYDEQHCYCQNQDLGNLVALFMQSEVPKICKLILCLMSVQLLYWVTQEELVIVDTHKHSENGTLVGISDDIASLLNWYQKSTQKYFNTVIRVCNLANI